MSATKGPEGASAAKQDAPEAHDAKRRGADWQDAGETRDRAQRQARGVRGEGKGNEGDGRENGERRMYGMYLLNLKDQRDIVKVIEYLVEIHQKNNTVGDVMKRYGITADEYRMCSNLAIPAIAQGNLKGRYKAVSRSNKAMRADIRAAYEATMDKEGPAAEALRMLYETHCVHRQNVTFGTVDGASEE